MTAIGAVASRPGSLNAGQAVAFTLTPDQAVQVAGSPTLSLSNGGVASYDAANSTATALRFNYTVAAGQDTADLQVTGLALNGGTITTTGGFGIGPAAAYPAGPTPFSVKAADLNGDGKADLVVADNGGGVAVLLGNGSGGFAAPTTFAAGPNPQSVTAVDLNGDGKLDLVVADNGGGVAVLLGNGSGGFAAPTTFAAGPTPYAVATADVNGDGKLDLVVADQNSGAAVLLGNGSGGFAAPTTYAAGSNPSAVATADLNGDGKLDLVVADLYGAVSVLLGNGSGGFGAATTFAAGPGPNGLVATDLNGDGKADLVVSDYNGGVAVLLGDGSGGFGTATTYAAGQNPYAVTTADVNGDGKPDLVVPNLQGGTVAVLLGDGSGGFGAAATYAAGAFPNSVTAADVTGDGKPDIVVANGGSSVSVLLNTSQATGPFDTSTVPTAPGHDTGLSIDTVSPTVLSVVTAPSTASLGAGGVVTISVRLSEAVAVSGGVPTLLLNDGGTASYASGGGTSTLVFTTTIAAGQSTADLQVAGVALNGAVVQDAAGNAATLSGAATNPAGVLAVNAPSVTVTSVAAVPAAGSYRAGQAIGLTLTLSQAVQVSGSPTLSLSNGGTASYDAANSTATSLRFSYTVAAGQDTADLQVTGLALNGGTVAIPGRFGIGAATAYPAGPTPSSVTAADLNGDGKADLVVADNGGGIAVLLGDGSGGFASAVTYAAGPNPQSVTAADLNGDGKLDLVVADNGGGIAVLLGDGAGGFGAPATFAAGPTPYAVATADLNGDGKLDLVVADQNSGVAVLLGNGSGGFAAPTTYAAGSNPSAVATADLNGDGKLDLVVADLYGAVSVLLGNGSGGFGAATTFAAGPGPNSLAAVDVNGDGKADLVVSDYNGGAAVLLGNGSGGFGAATTYAVGTNPYAVTTADMNGDGRLDLVFAVLRGGVSVLLGDGSGGFGAATTYAAGAFPNSVAAADVTGDGKPDIVVGNGGSSVSVLLNTSQAAGGFDPATAATAPGHDTGLIIDTLAPAVTEGLANDTGASATDRVTANPALAGTADANGVVTIANGAAVLGTVTASAAGRWAFTPSLADGSYVLTASETDAAGNTGSATLAFTLDTAAPVVTELLASDTGTSATDRITNTAALTGTAEANSVVTVRNGAAVLGSATASAAGRWAFTPSLADGSYVLTASETDTAGNTGSATLAFTLDTTAPAVTEVLVSDTGASATDRITSNPALTGTTDANSIVTIRNGAAVLGTVTSSAAGSWGFTPVLADGAYTLTASVTDVAGNTGTSALALTLDTVAPVVTEVLANDNGASATDRITSDPTLTGAAEANGVVTVSNGAAVLGTATATAAGRWSFVPRLADGRYSLTASETDTAGNTGTATLDFTLDTTSGTAAPVVTAVTASPANAVLGVGKTVVFAVSFSQAVAVSGGVPTLALNDGGTASYTGGSGTATLTFGYTVLAGQNTADLAVTGSALNGAAIRNGSGTAADLLGAVANPAGTLQVDTTAPIVTLALSRDTGVSAADRITSNPALTGTAEANTVVTISNGATVLGTATASAAGSWSFTPSLADGVVTLTASDADAAGNVGTATLAFTLDRVAQPVTVRLSDDTSSASSNGTTRDAALTGTAEPGGLVIVTEGGTPLASLAVDTTGSWGFSPALVAGAHTLVASVTDAAGNTGSAQVSFTLDQPPVIAGTVASQSVADTTTLRPFAQVSLADPDVGAAETVTITLLDTGGTATDANGTLAGAGLTRTGTGTYALAAGTPAQVAAALAAVVFTPTAGQAAPGTAMTTQLRLSVTDDLGAQAVDGTTSVLALGSLHPFATIAVQNPDTTTVVTVSAQLQPATQGSFGTLGGGSVSTDGTTYTVTGSVTQVNAALAAVVFTPALGATAPAAASATLNDASGTSTLASTSSTGNVLTAATPGEVVTGGSGPDTLFAGAANVRLVGGGGSDVLVGNATGTSTLVGGSGSTVFFAQGGPTRIEGGQGHDQVYAPIGNVTVVSGTGGSLIGLGAGTALVNGQGADTIVGGAGTATISAASGSVVSLGAGPAAVLTGQGATVVGGAGADTVGVTGSGAVFFAGAGTSTFIGGSGSSTVVGGTGSETLFGGAGGGVFAGGSAGGNVIVAGQQATTIFGGGNGDVLFAQGSGGDVLVAGSGSETLGGVGSSGNDLFFAGSGNNLVGLGSGQDTVFAGTGNATVVAGTGRDLFAFVNGRAGGTESIIGFKLGTDQLSLQGYADGEIGRALAGASTNPGSATQAASTTLTLSDNTRIVFLGLNRIDARAFG